MAAVFLGHALPAVAEDDENLLDGRPIENVIVERDVAIRFRAELKFTEDGENLLDNDPAYHKYPSEILQSQVKLFHRSSSSLGVSYLSWSNPQDLDMTSVGISGRTPISRNWRMALKYKHLVREDDYARDYYYLGFSRSLAKGLYSYTQYRYSMKTTEQEEIEDVATTNESDEVETSHQLSEYLSWTCNRRFRMGGQAAYTQREEGDDVWYAKLFTSTYLIQNKLSLRLQARHYRGSGDFSYNEYKSYLYQRLNKKALLRLSYRIYEDSNEHDSNAWGMKFKGFFSKRASAHVGYRKYTHSEGADFDTVFAGISLLL